MPLTFATQLAAVATGVLAAFATTTALHTDLARFQFLLGTTDL